MNQQLFYCSTEIADNAKNTGDIDDGDIASLTAVVGLSTFACRECVAAASILSDHIVLGLACGTNRSVVEQT